MLVFFIICGSAALAFWLTKIANMPNSGSWFKYIVSLPNSMPLWPAKPKWTVENDMPDLNGKVCLVTGGNGGIGFETCKALYGHNATVYLACRDTEKARTAIDQIQDAVRASEGKLDVIKLDLADLRSVESAVKEFQGKEDRLDILYCNAGVMATPKGLRTAQGFKLQLGTNGIGHTHLVSLLLPLLLKTRKTTGIPSRVITTTSFGHISAVTGGIDYDNYDKPVDERVDHPPFTEYGISKWANLAMARYLDIEYGKKGDLISVPVHPGMIASELGRHQPGYARIKDYVMPVVTWPTALGAVSQLYAGTCDLETARKISGEYVVPWAQIGTMRPDLNDDAACRKAWEWMEAQGRTA